MQNVHSNGSQSHNQQPSFWRRIGVAVGKILGGLTALKELLEFFGITGKMVTQWIVDGAVWLVTKGLWMINEVIAVCQHHI